jgi:hypothetical protein
MGKKKMKLKSILLPFIRGGYRWGYYFNVNYLEEEKS